MIIYVESSAAAKLLLAESETSAMIDFFDGFAEENHGIVSNALLETELRRVALRTNVPQIDVTSVLDRIDLIDVDRATFSAAGLLPDPGLRSLDALHLASAMRVRADLFVTYDDRQKSAAEAAGLRAVSPGNRS